MPTPVLHALICFVICHEICLCHIGEIFISCNLQTCGLFEKPWQEIGEQLQAMQTPHAHPIKDHHVTTFFIAFVTLKMSFNNWRSLLTESNSDWRLYNDANKHFRRRLFFFLTKYSTSEGRFTIFFFIQEINENPS